MAFRHSSEGVFQAFVHVCTWQRRTRGRGRNGVQERGRAPLCAAPYGPFRQRCPTAFEPCRETPMTWSAQVFFGGKCRHGVSPLRGLELRLRGIALMTSYCRHFAVIAVSVSCCSTLCDDRCFTRAHGSIGVRSARSFTLYDRKRARSVASI